MVQISRREFIKLTGLQIAAAFLPWRLLSSPRISDVWPVFSLGQLPTEIQRIFELIPNTGIDTDGYLCVYGRDGSLESRISLIPTDWSEEHRSPADLLYQNYDWGIVLHWFGDREHHHLDISGYLEGFNDEQVVEGKELRTSAHFLVGDGVPNIGSDHLSESLGIIQTQRPGPHGRPYVSSHLLPAPFESLADPRHYFIRAFDKVFYNQPFAHSILQDLSQDPSLDPNMVTLSIEIAGHEFDNLDSYPSQRKIANVVSVVWAIMKRYRIPPQNILGHLEINLEKPDPGKKFLTLIRYLIGVKALVSADYRMKELVFSPFFTEDIEYSEAIDRYFNFVRDYLLLVSNPRTVYEWERESKFWQLQDLLMDRPHLNDKRMVSAQFPLDWNPEDIPPGNRRFPDISGVEIPADRAKGSNLVKLMANGQCLYRGFQPNSTRGNTAIFRHREDSGAEVLSVYSGLDRFGDISLGQFFNRGHIVGEIDAASSFLQKTLNFSVAYLGTWEKELSNDLTIPGNAGKTWISERYIDPLTYVTDRSFIPNDEYVTYHL